MRISQAISTFIKATLRFLPAVAGTVVLVIVIAWMAGAYRQKVAPGESPFERRTNAGLETAAVATLQTTEEVDAVGTVQPRMKTDVASRLLATINEVNVQPADVVQQGQLLATLDDREMQAQLREAEAAAAGIEADLAMREREYARYKQMFAEEAVTKESFDQVEGAYRVTQAQLRRTNEQIKRIEVMLTYAQINAQTSGVVVDRYLDPGDLAVPGKPLLTIHDPQELELHASVREGLAGRVHVGMQLPIRIDALSRTMNGTVREIVPYAEATSRSVLVKVTMPPDQLEGLYIGMFGRLSIPVGSINRIVVDNGAVQRVGQLELVDVVRDDGTLDRRFIRTGLRIGNKTEILSGLNVNETVAIAPIPEQTM